MEIITYKISKNEKYPSKGICVDSVDSVDMVYNSVAEIWCEALGGQQKEMTPYNTKFIHKIMADLPEWERSKAPMRRKNYGMQKGYVHVKLGKMVYKNKLGWN